MESCAVILPGGRRLAFGLFGAVRGTPVVALHPAAVDWAPAQAAASRLRIRLVVPDPASATDLAVLADALGIGGFGLIGMGDGADLAVACAAELGDRVTRLALCCCPPTEDRLAAVLGWFAGPCS